MIQSIQSVTHSDLPGARPFAIHAGKVGCLMVHGFTGTPFIFLELAKTLADRGISVSAPLLPGHGTRPEDMIGIHWEHWIDAVRNECEMMKKNCDDLFLLGHSVGGSIALYLAGEIPIQGVISLSAPVQFRDWWAFFIPYAKRFKRYWKKRHKPDSPEWGYDRYPLEAVFELLLFLDEFKENLPQIACPALIMHAFRDGTVSPDNAGLIYDGITSTVKKKVLLEHPGHLITKGEDARIIQNEVLLFIRSNRSRVYRE